MTASTEDATKNGSMPMSMSRVKALGASFVCSVLKTRCPVRLALIAMFAGGKVDCLDEHAGGFVKIW